jgi:hypothetical protein
MALEHSAIDALTYQRETSGDLHANPSDISGLSGGEPLPSNVQEDIVVWVRGEGT